jgi:predicted glycoside hydrolase/deacetylase ChbG (UPF0249 family)
MTRRLILHADDFGMNSAVTYGIVEAFARGLLTSTSLLANAPDAGRALALWRQLQLNHSAGHLPSSAIRRRLDAAPIAANETPPIHHRVASAESTGEVKPLARGAQPHDVQTGPAAFDLGVHLNLTQGFPLTGDRYPRALCERDGRFCGIGRFFWNMQRNGSRHRSAVAQELAAQIEFLLDHAIVPTHLNGHQYAELLPTVRDVVVELAGRYRIDCVRVAREPSFLRTTALRGEIANGGLATIKRLHATPFRRRAIQAGLGFPDAYFGASHAGRIDLRLLRSFLRSKFRTAEIGMHPGLPCRGAGVPPVDSPGVREHPAALAARPAAPWHDPLESRRPRELELLCSEGLARVFVEENIQLGRIGACTGAATSRRAA